MTSYRCKQGLTHSSQTLSVSAITLIFVVFILPLSFKNKMGRNRGFYEHVDNKSATSIISQEVNSRADGFSVLFYLVNRFLHHSNASKIVTINWQLRTWIHQRKQQTQSQFFRQAHYFLNSRSYVCKLIIWLFVSQSDNQRVIDIPNHDFHQ